MQQGTQKKTTIREVNCAIDIGFTKCWNFVIYI